jgi:hypothetical protein
MGVIRKIAPYAQCHPKALSDMFQDMPEGALCEEAEITLPTPLWITRVSMDFAEMLEEKAIKGSRPWELLKQTRVRTRRYPSVIYKVKGGKDWILTSLSLPFVQNGVPRVFIPGKSDGTDAYCLPLQVFLMEYYGGEKKEEPVEY